MFDFWSSLVCARVMIYFVHIYHTSHQRLESDMKKRKADVVKAAFSFHFLFHICSLILGFVIPARCNQEKERECIFLSPLSNP